MTAVFIECQTDPHYVCLQTLQDLLNTRCTSANCPVHTLVVSASLLLLLHSLPLVHLYISSRYEVMLEFEI